jgi:hypothetical protein
MEIIYNDILVERWNNSKTLEQEFSPNVKFTLGGLKAKIDEKTYFNFDKYRSEKKAIITIEWAYNLETWIDYSVKVQYYATYLNFDGETIKIKNMVSDSIKRSESEFTKKIPKMNLGFFFRQIGKPDVDPIRQLIQRRIREER